VTPSVPPKRPLEEAARLLRQALPEDAARICLAVVEKAPEATAAWRLLGNARAVQRRYDDAIRCYRRVVELRPDSPDSCETYNNLGAVHQIQSNSKLAAKSIRRAIELKPDYAQAHCNLGAALRKLGRLEDAITCQHRAIEIAPDYAKAHYNLGNALKEASERVASIGAYRQAIALDPGHAEAHNNFGTVLEGQGHTEKALGEFFCAMALDETYVEAHYNHALLHRFQADDPALDKLRQLEGQYSLNQSNKNRLAFALAKAKSDVGDYDGAFTDFVQANTARRQRSSYNKLTAEREVESIMEAAVECPEGASPADKEQAPVPVFILGLSRSGKSLAESLLGSQAGVFAAGESEHWQRLNRAAMKNGPHETTAARLGTAYREQMHRLAGAAEYFVSTLDSNILSLTGIAVALPEARFVLCLREPVDNALLIYFKRYEQGHEHAYDFCDIANFMAQRVRLQAHWRDLLGERFITLEYEKIVQGAAATGEKIATHVGLEFDTSRALPYFHGNEIAMWKSYEKHLDPLHAALAQYRENK
jgi:tetratricopeptide (TPR) repeat protein